MGGWEGMAYLVEIHDESDFQQTINADSYQETQNGYLIEFHKDDQIVFAVAKHLVRSIKLIPEEEEGEKD